MRHRRSHLPTFVTRGSSSDAHTGPVSSSAPWTIDRNFTTLNGRFPSPMRSCV